MVGRPAADASCRDQTLCLPYSGISLGWGGWHAYFSQPDNNPNINADNQISSDLIFDVMRIRDDGGGIYTNGSQGRSYNHGLLEEGNVSFRSLSWL